MQATMVQLELPDWWLIWGLAIQVGVRRDEALVVAS